MKMSEPDGLSTEDLRNRLYHALKQKGLVDSLKSQLRNRLVSELKNVGLSQSFPPSTDGGSLLLRAANSLVADHMRQCHYDYSLSVFLPEIATSEDKLLTPKDLLQLLHVSPQSKLYSSLVHQHTNQEQKGFLWTFICELASICGQCSHSVSCQTEEVRLPAPTSLETEFRKVEEHFATLAAEGKYTACGLEERVLAYQRQLEERAHTELALQMARFKENELARMRMEERERSREAVQKVRRELESQYKVKSDALLERERHAAERLQQQEQMAEKESHAQRQSLLEEIEAVRQREISLRRQHEINEREKQLWEEKIKDREAKAKAQEEAGRRKELDFEQKIREECAKYKLEEQQKFMDRSMNLEFRESKVKEDERRLFKELQDVMQVKEELREKRLRINELEAENAKCQRDAITIEKEVEILREKAREMVDYQVYKEQNAIMKKEIESLKTRLSEVSRDNMMERQKQESLLREMTDLVSKPTPEVLLLQKELNKNRDELKQDRAIFEHYKYQSECRLNEETDRNHELLRKYEEQTLQLKEMNREVKDLRQQLLQTRSALDNEVYRNPKGSLMNRSGSLCDLDDDSEENVVREPLVIKSSPKGHRSHASAISPRTGDGAALAMLTDSEDYSYSLDLVEETKRRLRNLEAEAENLEKNYRNFQFRMTEPPPSIPADPIPFPSTSKKHLTKTSASASSANQLPTTPRSSRNALSAGFQPMSSTPAQDKRSSRSATNAHLETPPSHPAAPHEGSFISVSPVRSPSPVDAQPQPAPARQPRPLHMSDLEARPGSPDVVVLPGSESGGSKLSGRSHDLPGGHVTHATAAVVPPSDHWQQPVVSLDSAWKSKQAEEDERRKSEEEREQRGAERGQDDRLEEDAPKSAQSEDANIDPVMKKYMAMIQEKKEKEEQAKKSGGQSSAPAHRDRTTSHSEHDFSAPDEKSEPPLGDISDGGDDFW